MMNQRSEIHCKNHPTFPGGYYLVEQPWVKLCSQCALDLAVCGKKIDKELSEMGMERKLLLNNLMEDIKQTSRRIQWYSEQLGQASQQIEEVVEAEIGAELKRFDEFVERLEKIREQLWNVYQEKIVKQVNRCFERQSKMILNGIELKKILQNIDANFNRFIEDNEENKGLDDSLKEWRQLIYSTRQLMPETEIKPAIEIQLLKAEFSDKFLNIQKKINDFHCPYFLSHRDNASKQNKQSLATETPQPDSLVTHLHHSRITHLKLRSAPKKSHHKKQTKSVLQSRKRTNVRDITNVVTRISGWRLS